MTDIFTNKKDCRKPKPSLVHFVELMRCVVVWCCDVYVVRSCGYMMHSCVVHVCDELTCGCIFR